MGSGNFYAQANDGFVGYVGATAWSTVRSAATGTTLDTTTDEISAPGSYKDGSTIVIYRGRYKFDLSSIPAGATITSAIFYFWVGTTYGSKEGLRAVSTAQADLSATSDYNQTNFGGSTPTSYGSITAGNITTGQYNSITVDTSIVVPNGNWYLGIRGENDFSNTEPAGVNIQNTMFSEYTGSASDPYLYVEWELPGVGRNLDLRWNQLESSSGTGLSLTDYGSINQIALDVVWTPTDYPENLGWTKVGTGTNYPRLYPSDHLLSAIPQGSGNGLYYTKVTPTLNNTTGWHLAGIVRAQNLEYTSDAHMVLEGRDATRCVGAAIYSDRIVLYARDNSTLYTLATHTQDMSDNKHIVVVYCKGNTAELWVDGAMALQQANTNSYTTENKILFGDINTTARSANAHFAECAWYAVGIAASDQRARLADKVTLSGLSTNQRGAIYDANGCLLGLPVSATDVNVSMLGTTAGTLRVMNDTYLTEPAHSGYYPSSGTTQFYDDDTYAFSSTTCLPKFDALPSMYDSVLKHVSWDKYGGGDFSSYEVHFSASSGFTPGSGTLWRSISDATNLVCGIPVPASATRYAKLKLITTGDNYISNEITLTNGAVGNVCRFLAAKNNNDGTVTLDWGTSLAGNQVHVHRNAVAAFADKDFTPAAGNRIATNIAPPYTDNPGAGAFAYRLTTDGTTKLAPGSSDNGWCMLNVSNAASKYHHLEVWHGDSVEHSISPWAGTDIFYAWGLGFGRLDTATAKYIATITGGLSSDTESTGVAAYQAPHMETKNSCDYLLIRQWRDNRTIITCRNAKTGRLAWAGYASDGSDPEGGFVKIPTTEDCLDCGGSTESAKWRLTRRGIFTGKATWTNATYEYQATPVVDDLADALYLREGDQSTDIDRRYLRKLKKSDGTLVASIDCSSNGGYCSPIIVRDSYCSDHLFTISVKGEVVKINLADFTKVCTWTCGDTGHRIGNSSFRVNGNACYKDGKLLFVADTGYLYCLDATVNSDLTYTNASNVLWATAMPNQNITYAGHAIATSLMNTLVLARSWAFPSSGLWADWVKEVEYIFTVDLADGTVDHTFEGSYGSGACFYQWVDAGYVYSGGYGLSSGGPSWHKSALSVHWYGAPYTIDDSITQYRHTGSGPNYFHGNYATTITGAPRYYYSNL